MLKIKRIAASTLPETIISLVILLSSFTIAVVIISSLFKETINESKAMLHFKITELKNETLKNNKYFDEDFSWNEYKIIKKVSLSDYNHQLIKVIFIAINMNNDTVETQERFIYIPDISIIKANEN